MDNSKQIAELANKILDVQGAMDFLDLADKITDETEIPVREVERTLRILLLDGALSKNRDFNIVRKAARDVTRQESQSSLER